MINKLKQQRNKLMQSQRGAALLMVLLVTVFVVIMGSSVMFTSYNSYIMRLVDREGVDTFYDTEEVTDLVRVHIQDAASEALQTAYTRVMAEYAFIQAEELYVEEDVQAAAQAKFDQYFIDELARYNTNIPGVAATENPQNLFHVNGYSSSGVDVSAGVTGYLSVAALENILGSVSTDGNVTVTGGVSTDSSFNASDSTANFDKDAVAAFTYTRGDDGYPRLVISNVTVSYEVDRGAGAGSSTDLVDGYTTNITTDIIIEMPMFIHTGDISQSNWEGGGGGMDSTFGLPFDNASSIGKLWVKSSLRLDSGLLVTGDIYGGTFLIYNDWDAGDPSDVVFSHGAGRLITHNGAVPVGEDEVKNVGASGIAVNGIAELDGIVIHEGTTFTSRYDSEIWTNSVSVREGSDVTLSGVRSNDYEIYKYFDEATNTWVYSDDYFGGTFVKNDVQVLGGLAKGEVDGYGQTSLYNNVSNIVLGGDVFGVSTGDTGATSSAIVLNGDDINLDMSDLSRILLGGTTYLQVGRASGAQDGNGTDLNVNSEYEMGQSIAATPDALAYMVPYNAIDGVSGLTSNPMVISGDFTNATILRSELPDWISDGKYVEDTPQIISRTYGDERLVYFFYQFESDAKRAGFIEQYIKYTGSDEDTTYKGYFENNLGLFVNMTNAETLESTSAAAGIVYYMTDSGLNVMNKALDGDDKALLSNYEKYYDNAAVTLWPDVPSCPSVPSTGYATYDLSLSRSDGRKIELQSPDNPFDYYVNMRGDNLMINYAYTELGGTNMDRNDNFESVKTQGLADNNKQPDLWAYFDHDSDGLYGTDSRYSTPGPLTYTQEVAGVEIEYTVEYNEDKPNINTRRIGLAEWTSPTGLADGGDSSKIFEFVLDGKVVAIYRSNGLNWGDPGMDEDTYPDCVMLLSRAGINIHEKFEGLAFSETGIALANQIDSIDMGFEKVLNARCVHPYTGDVKYLYEFFRNMNLTSQGGSTGDDGTDPTPGVSEDDAKVNWSPNDLVYYENWEKH